jgi:hypothetical protein
MPYIAQAAVAIALLVGLPFVLDPPAADEHMIAASLGALVLALVAIHGVMGYIRSRKPHSYHDSIMPPVEPPRK